MIASFRGDHAFLSNFYPSPVEYDGVTYPTVEHAYQAAKTLSRVQRMQIEQCSTAGKAKRMGKTVSMRPGWEDMKVAVMTDLTRQKFADPELRQKLLATGSQELVEGNNWGDTYWGVCNGQGENMLGKILESVRDEIASTPVEQEEGNPVYKGERGWYFWDETWAYHHGPYGSRDEAERELERYCREVLGA